MEEQIVKLDLHEDKGKFLGVLSISAEYHNFGENNYVMENCELINVPRVEKPDNETPIQYHVNKDLGNLSPLMFLEETKYQILFKSDLDLDENPLLLSSIRREGLNDSVFEILRFKIGKSSFAGILNFHSYVGKSFLDVTVNGISSKPFPIEVRSKKINYFEQYPVMIGDLASIASGIIFEMDSPLFNEFDFDLRHRKTLYEDFMFLEYIFLPENLPMAYEYIIRNMYTYLEGYEEIVPTSFASNLGPIELINIISMPDNLYKTDDAPSDWPESLNNYVPDKISQTFYHEIIDTPENRLLKYFLESLDKLIFDLLHRLGKNKGYARDQLLHYQGIIQDHLSERWVNEVGKLTYIPSNSQVIQKKEGYRDIFKFYLNYEFSFRLKWNDVEDHIKGYERKLSELYEYWCYFKILSVLSKLTFKKIDFTDIYEVSSDEWSIKVKRGLKSIHEFILNVDGIEINIILMYNRLFSKNTHYRSYSLPFRPDYTLLIKYNKNNYFIHFDAKYRSEGKILEFYEKIGSKISNKDNLQLELEQAQKRDLEEQKFNEFKFGDVYKMHTYKDAILNTEGAYIFYPGDKKEIFTVNEGEPIPSVGAFPLTPGKNGLEEDELKSFIISVLKNLITSH